MNISISFDHELLNAYWQIINTMNLLKFCGNRGKCKKYINLCNISQCFAGFILFYQIIELIKNYCRHKTVLDLKAENIALEILSFMICF
jgi:hypothetical protein